MPVSTSTSTIAAHGPNRFYELLEAIKTEYEVAISSTATTAPASDASRRMNREDYELKLLQHVNDMNAMQRTIAELERTFLRMKREYEEEIGSLRRSMGGSELASSETAGEDVRPLIHGKTVVSGASAIAGLFAASSISDPAQVGVKRRASASFSTEDSQAQGTKPEQGPGALATTAPMPRSLQPRLSGSSTEGASGLSGGSTSSASVSASASTSSTSTYDWLVAYNPKVPRSISLDLRHSVNFDGGVVCCVKFSANGRILAASGNKMCAFYDVETGKLLHLLPHDSQDGGDLYVRSMSFSPDGRFFVTGSEDHLIRVWSLTQTAGNQLEAPRLVKSLIGHSQDVYALEFVDRSRLIVSGSGDQTLRFWNIESGECIRVIKAHNDTDQSRECGITSIAVCPEGKFVAAGSLDRLVRVWNAESGELVHSLTGHEDSVYSVCFDGRDALISASLDKSVRVWSLKQGGTCAEVITGHKDFVLAVVVCATKTAIEAASEGEKHANASASASEARWIISGSKDRSVQFWNLNNHHPQLTLHGHKNSVISVAMSPTGSLFATGSGDCRTRIWSLHHRED